MIMNKVTIGPGFSRTVLYFGTCPTNTRVRTLPREGTIDPPAGTDSLEWGVAPLGQCTTNCVLDRGSDPPTGRDS